MKSKKDQGNNFFKKEKYPEAIDCYTEYVRVNNPDNSKAYTNMALSFFRLKKYQECVKACESAVEIEPQNEKAQYRMYEAYKELNDNYGMLIAAQKFCKLSKQEKEITPIQKILPKVKEELSYAVKKDSSNPQSDKIMLQIVNELKGSNQVVKPKKQPLICLEAKWQKIQQLAKDSRRLAINQAKRFLVQQCKTQQEKQKYKKLIPQLRVVASENSGVPNKLKQTSDQTDSSEEDIKLQDLKKYSEEQDKKAKQAQQKTKAKKNQKKQQVSQVPKPKEQIVVKPIPQKAQPVPVQQTQNHVQQSKPKQQLSKQQPAKSPKPQGKWEDFIKQQEAQSLYETHIKAKMSKYEDQFIGLYQCLTNLLRSTDLDRFQKEAILSLTPTKLKKFNLLMKSYTGTEKQELSQLFTENNLHSVMQKYSLKK